MEWSRKTQDLSKQGRHIIRHPVANHLPSSNSSGRNLLCRLSQFWSWHGPHAAVHGSPYLLQEQRNVLQALEQLQWMIFKRLSAWSSNHLWHNWDQLVILHAPSPVHSIYVILISNPGHDLVVCLRQWNLVADSVGGRRNDNFPAESVISHCC